MVKYLLVFLVFIYGCSVYPTGDFNGIVCDEIAEGEDYVDVLKCNDGSIIIKQFVGLGQTKISRYTNSGTIKDKTH